MLLAPLVDVALDTGVTIEKEPGEAIELRVEAASEITWPEQFAVGSTSYSLKRTLLGRFHLGPEGLVLAMSELAPIWVGIGPTRTAAEDDLKAKLHAEFQHLVSMRPFQMEGEDRAKWAILASVIDVAAYRRETPLELREIGRVDWYKRQPSWKGMLQIVWLDGREELIPFTEAPPQFAGLRPPAWLDAVVLRDPVSGKFIRMVSCQRTRSVDPMPRGAAAGYLSSLPSPGTGGA